MSIRLREAGDSALLLTLGAEIDAAVNTRAIVIADRMRRETVSGVRDILSTYCSVAVYFDPLRASIEQVRAALERAQQPGVLHRVSQRIEVPVAYGDEFGPDLDALAMHAGIAPREIVERHSGTGYRVFLVGFLPGFPYMGVVDEQLAAPRHATPRVRVPAGSVGIAGRQTGIYPLESPGGWQIIGRTNLRLFDVSRHPPATLAPGDTVTFRAVARDDIAPDGGGRSDAERGSSRTLGRNPASQSRLITVVRPGMFTTVQDYGRWGHQGSGVPISGAMDVASHRQANEAVGNGDSQATLEVTLQGPELRFEHDALVAVAGADLGATLDGRALPRATAASCTEGSVLRFGERKAGARAYIAFDGGIDVAVMLGSRSTHVLSGLGGFSGRALRAGDVLSLGNPGGTVGSRVRPVAPLALGGARLRVLPGPQDDVFMPAALDALQRARFTISPQSNRMGYRLTGGPALPRVETREMISDATFTGAVQVPPSGDPILLMADRQTVGGYPQIVTVITADLPKAGQLAPGDWIEFELCSRADAIAALTDADA